MRGGGGGGGLLSLSFFAIINRVPHKKLKRVGIDHPFY
jgi:hypothetical protein